jgi:DNA-binding NtrC family response regulator
MATLFEGATRHVRPSAQPPVLVGAGEVMERLRLQIEVAARRSSTVLIHGESGTGKELVARHIHSASSRVGGPFIPVDCTTLQNTLFESQLFGHVRGAFTGADHATLGFFRSADGGTLFLDEIGELQLHVQAKLLRCIQDRQVVPLGGVEPIPVDIRFVAATHRDLKAMVSRGEFRQDLYYRLNVLRLTAPPLRERRSDIGLLADHFLANFSYAYAEPIKTVSLDAVEVMQAYDWPGNVRELANVVEQAHVFSNGLQIQTTDLAAEVQDAFSVQTDPPAHPGQVLGVEPLEQAERHLVAKALRVAGGNQARAARMLEIDRRRLYRMVRHYDLQSMTHRASAGQNRVLAHPV